MKRLSYQDKSGKIRGTKYIKCVFHNKAKKVTGNVFFENRIPQGKLESEGGD